MVGFKAKNRIHAAKIENGGMTEGAYMRDLSMMS